MNLKAKAILAYTVSGDTPGILSAFCPVCPIYAITSDPMVARQINLEFNVYPIVIEQKKNVDSMIQAAIEKLQLEQKVEKGDTIIIAGGASIIPEVEDAEINKVIGGIIRI